MTGRWVCLMYHDIVPALTAGSGPQYFAVPAETFGRQLDLLTDIGLRGSSIADCLAQGGPRIAISFDDGDEGQYARGFAALAERGLGATFFITTSWVGTPNFVTWAQLREMRAAGMSIQSHTHSHPFLSELDGRALLAELREAKLRLDDGLGQDTDTLALPGGDAPRDELWPLIAEAGYRLVATSRWGVNGVPLARRNGLPVVRRCTVRGEQASDLFERVARGDRWLAAKRGTREWVLATLRRAAGPTRYARWRRRVLGDAPET